MHLDYRLDDLLDRNFFDNFLDEEKHPYFLVERKSTAF